MSHAGCRPGRTTLLRTCHSIASLHHHLSKTHLGICVFFPSFWPLPGDPKGLEIMAQCAEGTPGQGPQVPSWAEGSSSGKMEEPHLEATCEPLSSAAHWCKC